jgi:hypothetical protein
MSVDRRIDLNLSMPDFGAGGLQSGKGDASANRHLPDEAAEQRFAAALAGDGKSEEKQTPVTNASPFALFQQSAPSVQGKRNETMPRQSELTENLGNEVERLMVSDGSSGNRQVKMELKDDLLPGVTVAIQELEGRLQVDFVCSVESSRQRLNSALPDLASTLAQRLGRDVLMRVQTDDEDDPCLLEALGSA